MDAWTSATSILRDLTRFSKDEASCEVLSKYGCISAF